MPWDFTSVADLFNLLPQVWRSLPALAEFEKSKCMTYLTRLLCILHVFGGAAVGALRLIPPGVPCTF